MPATQLNLTEALAHITGSDHVRVSGDIVTVSPANTQQVSEVLRYATQNGLTVTPTGGNTKQSWANPVAANIRLDLARLNRVLEHPWQDLTCTVQAGCTWQHLQETLAQHGQFVALDPLWPHRATVGGILATNDSGALRHKYGSLRDLVIGMTLVLADGTIARSGGKVVKNVAGYDLPKLMTGSFGTLAVITEATFRLHSLPQHTQTFTVHAPQAQQLAPLMANVRASHLLTQALQLRGDTNGFHLDIQLNAHPEARQNEILQKMAVDASLKLELASDEVWQAREGLFNHEGTVIKLSVRPSDIARMIEFLKKSSNEVEFLFVAQASGLIYFALVATATTVENYLDSFEGEYSILSSPTQEHGLRAGSNAIHVMRAIKSQFDANRTLNPGRLIGGI